MSSTIGKRKRVETSKTSQPIKKVAIKAPINGKDRTRTRTAQTGVHSLNDNSFTAVSAPANNATTNRQQNHQLSPTRPSQVQQRQPDQSQDSQIHVQIITGSYERVLHGICATIPRTALEWPSTDKLPDVSEAATFSDTFLFAAHASAVRCLAVSAPTDQHSDKRLLATGSSDERINLYSLSTVPLPADATYALPSLHGTPTVENPRNRSLGSLNHHDRAITFLTFPVRTKLVSAAEDATIAISRTRDWTVLSSIKAPIPKPQGRPSGDTAAPGEVPAGVSDIAIHPSQRLMLSVGRGERCLRLWNLMTGKKAGVLNFDRDLLSQLGEGKHASGEGRRVLWDSRGELYVVGFERAAALFGMDSKPKAIIKPSPPTKIHQMRVLPCGSDDQVNVLAVSTEDGRILFYDMNNTGTADESGKLPSCVCIAQLGGRDAGITGRVKDFELLHPFDDDDGAKSPLLVVTGSSDGAIRLWAASKQQLSAPATPTPSSKISSDARVSQIGQLVGTLETGDRITCLGAFVLNGTQSDPSPDDNPSHDPENEEPSEEDEDSDEP